MALLLYYLHALIPFFIVIMPFLHVNLLKKFFLPIILPIRWIIFGTCPLNKYHSKQSKDSFIKSLLNKFVDKKINNKQTNNIVTLTLLLSVTLSSLKIMRHYKIYNNRN